MASLEVIRALERVVSAEPENTALRLHLAELLSDQGRPEEALAHLEWVLLSEPDNLDALKLATLAGEAVGDERASAWWRLHESLQDSVAGEAESHDDRRPAPLADPVTVEAAADLPVEADWDQFLKEVLKDAGYLEPVTLADVGGLGEVKQRLEQTFLAPLRNPELRRTYGAHLRGGLLLWGPPGCGKTFLARAVAGELGAQFISVGLHQILDMWLGNSEKQLHELFEAARRHNPCVLFFDELDAIGHSRMDLGRSAARNVVAQLLVELDGVDTSNEGIFVIGATNQPWDVDPALRRPGRFDRTMLLLPPEASARAAILSVHLRDRPLGLVDFEQLAQATEGMSGADLRLICDEAAERALSDAIRTSTVQPIGMEQLEGAIAAVRPSTGPWFESARNHVRYANAAGDYDELADYLRQRRSR
jgi:SpoVK/Ycf46/Vps4 family AAA+-type ATPase